VYSRAASLEQVLHQLKRENKQLRERLDTTEQNVQSFMREMGGLLDKHEFKVPRRA
jgi:hypothetical protein